MARRTAMYPTIRLILIALTLTAVAQPALACRCAPQTRAQALAQADAVFTGTITTVQTQGRQHVATLRVSDVAKGTVDALVQVRSDIQGSACGVTLALGESIELAVRSGDDGIFTADLCGQTGLQAKL